MLSIGDGIALGCLFLAAYGYLRMAGAKKNNPNSKYLLTERFEEYKEGTKTQLDALVIAVGKVEDGIKRVHKRIDEWPRASG